MNLECFQAMQRLVEARNIAIEDLTQKQVADALLQAIASGDFQRLVTTNDRQCVIYIPFAESERLKSEIKRLESILTEHGIEH